VDLVDVEIAHKQGDHEDKRGDEALPQPEPESGDGVLVAGCACEVVGAAVPSSAGVADLSNSLSFDTLTIRHSIPMPSGDAPPPNDPGPTPSRQPDYPLRPRRVCASVGEGFETIPPRRGRGHRFRSSA
jgi:hypothetical protein